MPDEVGDRKKTAKQEFLFRFADGYLRSLERYYKEYVLLHRHLRGCDPDLSDIPMVAWEDREEIMESDWEYVDE